MGVISPLQHLFLALNKLTGTVPSEIGKLSNLIALPLSDNDLSGTIEFEGPICTLENLVELIADCHKVVCPCCTKCCVENPCPAEFYDIPLD